MMGGHLGPKLPAPLAGWTLARDATVAVWEAQDEAARVKVRVRASAEGLEVFAQAPRDTRAAVRAAGMAGAIFRRRAFLDAWISDRQWVRRQAGGSVDDPVAQVALLAWHDVERFRANKELAHTKAQA